MAARVTAADVQAVMPMLDDEVVLYPFIQTASTLVDAVLLSSGLGTSELFEIERWLSAHFAALASPAHTEVGSGVYRVKLETPVVDKGLQGTRYGQVAVSLDRTGALARVQSGGQPSSFEML
jgi:hypothetical protein